MKKTTLNLLLSAFLIGNLSLSAAAQSTDVPQKVEQNGQDEVSSLPVIDAELTVAPNVPAPIKRDYPARVIVKLEALEKIMEIMPQVQFKYWTYNGSTPAPFIRVREGDTVEVHLSNPINSKLPHSSDFTLQRHLTERQWRVIHCRGTPVSIASKHSPPGLYLYHCAAMPGAPTHIGKGMFGLMLVEPKAGLPPVDKEFYIVQNEFYTSGEFGEPGLQVFSSQKASYELPDYVRF